MTLRQHMMPNPPPITDRMSDGACGTGSHDFIGQGAVVTAYDIPDSDRTETLLLFESGKVIQLSCDPGYKDDDVTRDPTRWEVVLYDATDTEAGRAIKTLEPGQWL